MARALLLSLLALASSRARAADLARGWGDALAWRPLADARAEAAAAGKPIMLVISKSYCGACKALKPLFAASAAIAEAAADFVMVNAVDDEEPAGAEFAPDGGYIPRVLFLSPGGAVQTGAHAQNAARAGDKYLYFHSSPDTIVTAMKAVAARTAAAALADEPAPPRADADL